MRYEKCSMISLEFACSSRASWSIVEAPLQGGTHTSYQFTQLMWEL